MPEKFYIFDWTHAAELIKKLKPKTAYAGLMEDWSSTSGKIIHNYEPYLEDYTFLASSWAHPVLKIDDVFYDCYITGKRKPDCNEYTKWPKEAIEVL